MYCVCNFTSLSWYKLVFTILKIQGLLNWQDHQYLEKNYYLKVQYTNLDCRSIKNKSNNTCGGKFLSDVIVETIGFSF